MTPDIRWIQRLTSFEKALSQLEKFIAKGDLNELEIQGLVKAFEYTYELAWTLLKEYQEFQGDQEIRGARDAIRQAFRVGLIADGTVWMDMLKSRNLTSHIYNEETANQIAFAIREHYIQQFRALASRFRQLRDKELTAGDDS